MTPIGHRILTLCCSWVELERGSGLVLELVKLVGLEAAAGMPSDIVAISLEEDLLEKPTAQLATSAVASVVVSTASAASNLDRTCFGSLCKADGECKTECSRYRC